MSGPVMIDGVLHGAHDLVAEFVHGILGASHKPAGPYVSHGVLDHEGKIIFGCLWFNYREGEDIEAAIAASDIRPALPCIFQQILDYPFGVLKLPRFTAEIRADNARMIRFAEGIGMKREGLKRGTDIAIYGLLPSEARFWRPKHG